MRVPWRAFICACRRFGGLATCSTFYRPRYIAIYYSVARDSATECYISITHYLILKHYEKDKQQQQRTERERYF